MKPLNFENLLKYSEKLLRFRDPFLNKIKIYKEIIQKNCIVPKFNKNSLEVLDICILESIATLIFNKSIEYLAQENSDLLSEKNSKFISLFIAYENTITFSSQKLIEELFLSEHFIILEKPGRTAIEFSNVNKIDSAEIIYLLKSIGYGQCADLSEMKNLTEFDKVYINYFTEHTINYDLFFNYIIKSNNIFKLPVLTKRIFKLWQFIQNRNTKLEDLCKKSLELREKLKVPVSPEIFLITEGITEEQLLPTFSQIYGFDFASNGVYLTSAGGKNQVLKMYKDYKDKLNIPIFVLLDSDAKTIAEEISSIKRFQDNVYVIGEGEFEDILTHQLILKTINNNYSLLAKVNKNELRSENSMVLTLKELWKLKGFGDFSKAEFAKQISDNISEKSDISATIVNIFDSIKSTLNKS